jgi:hypothetical protein
VRRCGSVQVGQLLHRYILKSKPSLSEGLEVYLICEDEYERGLESDPNSLINMDLDEDDPRSVVRHFVDTRISNYYFYYEQYGLRFIMS